MSGLIGKRQLQARFKAVGKTEVLLRQIGLRGVQEAQYTVPRRTGNLRRTIRLGDVGRDHVSIKAGGSRDVGYAAAVEFGSRAHDIVPVRAKVLAWGGPRTLGGRLRKGGKATHFARRVHHPGTRAQPYLGPGLKTAAEEGSDIIVEIWNGAA